MDYFSKTRYCRVDNETGSMSSLFVTRLYEGSAETVAASAIHLS